MRTAALVWAGLAAAGFVANAQPSLKDAYKSDFLVGAALNPPQFRGDDPKMTALITSQFSTITSDNALKWQSLHPQNGSYNFDLSDKFVEFGEQNKMFIVGHTLVWHSQTPAWVFQDDKGAPISRKALLERLRDHIRTVVGRYKGRVKGWDVVNEALNDDGTLRQSPWFKIIGEDYIAKAFQWAHEADPAAELYYNDYSLHNPAKRKGAIELIRKLKAQGILLNGIGEQGHYMLDSPSLDEVDQTIGELSQLGLKVMITEFDIDVLPAAFDYRGADIARTAEMGPKLNPYTNGLPDEVQKQLADRYAGLFKVFLKYRSLSRVTFWGVTDKDSWKNHWPVRGRTNYPLLFDREGKPKPAFDAVIEAAKF